MITDSISLEDGKYVVNISNSGHVWADRYNEEKWRDLTGDKLFLAMAHEILRLQSPTINIRCETTDGFTKGMTFLNVIKVEREDDGSFTVVTDHWPDDNSNELTKLRAQNERVKKLFTYLDQVEESDSGREFRPVYISCCRSMQNQDIEKLLVELKEGTK